MPVCSVSTSCLKNQVYIILFKYYLVLPVMLETNSSTLLFKHYSEMAKCISWVTVNVFAHSIKMSNLVPCPKWGEKNK